MTMAGVASQAIAPRLIATSTATFTATSIAILPMMLALIALAFGKAPSYLKMAGMLMASVA